MRRLLACLASGFLLATAQAAEPGTAATSAAERAPDLVAAITSETDGRVVDARGAPDAVRLVREAAAEGAHRIVLVVTQDALDAERAAWSALARELRAAGRDLQLYGVGDDGAASSITWSSERSTLLTSAQAASPLEADLGTGTAFERSAAAAFERAAREDRLVLLVQLSGRFDAVPET